MLAPSWFGANVDHLYTGLRVLVIYNDSQDLIKGRPQDIVAERGVVHCAQVVAEALASAGCIVEMAPITADVEVILARYSPAEWLVFNLGEGLGGRLFEEVRIAWVLEAMGYRYTGSDAWLWPSPHTRLAPKPFCRTVVCPLPSGVCIQSCEVTGLSLEGLEFPQLFVKPVAEDASLGIDIGSVVRSAESLRDRVAMIVSHYHQAALVETFVDGREIYASLWGSTRPVLPLAEIDFQVQYGQAARVVSFSSKWQPDTVDWNSTPVNCPALVDSGLATQIRELALGSWHAIGGQGYGRVDMRVDQRGSPWILEVNCNPDLSPDGGFFTMAKAGGYTYPQMVCSILQFAMERTYGYYRPR